MKATEALACARGRPFRPFRIKLTNGSEYDIGDEFSVASTSDGEVLFLFMEDGSSVRVDSDAVSQITELSGKRKTRGLEAMRDECRMACFYRRKKREWVDDADMATMEAILANAPGAFEPPPMTFEDPPATN